jgi:peptide/nickel transport system substrate-binding protein
VCKRRPDILVRCGVLFLAGLLAGCGRATPGQQGVVEELNVGFPEDNGQGSDFGVLQFANLLSLESLTNNGTDGRPIPRLADSWRWENDGLRLRVTLHDRVKLHDGRPFRGELAAEIVRKAVTSKKYRLQYVALNDVRTVAAANDRELVFDLLRPSALLPEDLAVPLEAGGTGPYRVTSQTAAETILERFDAYYLGTPTVKKVRVHSYATLRPAWASLLRGDVDLVYDVPAEAVEFIRNDAVRVLRLGRWYQYAIIFNNRRGPLRSPAVRRALNMAVDRDALIQRVLRGSGTPSTGPVYPAYWAHDSSVTPPAFDPGQAAALLDAAGYPMRTTSDAAGRPPARLRFECLLPENFSVWERIALEVQKNLYSIGVDVQFKVISLVELNDRLSKGNFDATFIDLISGPGPGRTQMFWRSAKVAAGPYNVFGYENDEVEAAYGVLRANLNDAATRSATRRLQRAFLDDPPALFLAWNERTRAIRAELMLPSETGRDPLHSLWRWTRAVPATPVAAE